MVDAIPLLMRFAARPEVKYIFFGNYFYGVCALALAVEASTQQQFPMNSWSFYGMLFASTIWYYTYSYLHSSPHDVTNERLAWYHSRKKRIAFVQILLTMVTVSCAALITIDSWENLKSISPLSFTMLLLFPVTAVMYYGVGRGVVKTFNLRQLGQFKPFIIGFAWAGPVTIYPVLFYCLQNSMPYQLTLVGCLLFLKNFMFIAMIGIMFDIKDYAYDHRQRLGTFVTRTGLRKTIFTILIPLSVVGLGTFITYGMSRDFSVVKIILNTIPFVFLIMVAWSLAKRRTILYYLVVVDGLMLVKAVCGTIAMTFF